jgi:hypothetical protein
MLQERYRSACEAAGVSIGELDDMPLANLRRTSLGWGRRSSVGLGGAARRSSDAAGLAAVREVRVCGGRGASAAAGHTSWIAQLTGCPAVRSLCMPAGSRGSSRR